MGPGGNTPEQEFAASERSAVGDHATAEDTLGFKPYVDAVVAFLTAKATVPPLTMSVEGEWGSGKSSFLLQMEQAIAGPSSADKFWEHMPRSMGGLADRGSLWKALVEAHRCRQPPTIRFNAWRHDKQDALWAAFALAVSQRLRRRIGFWRSLRADLYLFALRLDGLRGWLELLLLTVSTGLLLFSASVLSYQMFARGGAEHAGDLLSGLISGNRRFYDLVATFGANRHGSWIGLLVLAAGGLVKFWNQIRLPISFDLKKYLKAPDYNGHSAFIEHFHEDFARLIRAYAGEQRVFVFIDDLDRCDVPRAAELMQAINLMISDAGNLIFIIGMDREKVAAGITQKYKDLLAFLPEFSDAERGRGDISFGYSYLEKFIHLTFALPIISSESTLNRFLNSMLPPQPARRWNHELSVYWRRRLDRNWGRVRRAWTAAPYPEPPAGFEPGREASPDASPSRAATLQTEIKIRRMRLQIDRDSAGIHEVVRMVSGLFESNPRRLKQFLSSYRLALALTSDQGILSMEVNPAAVTPQQLGKFIALTMRFPELRERLEQDMAFLQNLEAAADAWHGEADAATDPFARWLQRSAVRQLLLHGISQYGGTYSLRALDASRLLSLLPKAAPDPEPQPRPAAAASEKAAPPAKTAPPPREASPVTSAPPSGEYFAESPAAPVPQLDTLPALGQEYVQIRRSMPASDERTRAMTSLVRRVQAAARTLTPIQAVSAIESARDEGGEGGRMVALALAGIHRTKANLPWLLDMLREYRSNFEHYWTLQTLLLYRDRIDPSLAADVAQALESVMPHLQSDSGRAATAEELLRFARETASENAPPVGSRVA